MPVGATEFKARMETLFLAANPAKRSPHGAQTWFARTACHDEVSRKTIYAYTLGDRKVGGLLLIVLELMEERYGDLLQYADIRRLDYYRRKRAREQKQKQKKQERVTL
jgi:hypothetical protein